jgi:hypothetical protein
MGKGKKNKKNKASATEEVKEPPRMPAHLLVVAARWGAETDSYNHLLAYGPCEASLLPLCGHAFDGPFQTSEKFNDIFQKLWDQCKENIDEKKKNDPSAVSLSSVVFCVSGQDEKSPWNPAITKTITVHVTMPDQLDIKDVIQHKWSDLLGCLYQIQGPMIYVDGETSMVMVEAGKSRIFVFGVFGKRTINGSRTTDMEFHLLPSTF